MIPLRRRNGLSVAWLWGVCVLMGCGTSAPSNPAPPLKSHQVGGAGAPANKASDLVTASAARADDWFEDATGATGIQFTHRNGREGDRCYMIESFGGGVAAFDFDRDGPVDLFFTGGGTIDKVSGAIGGLPSALYRNRGAARFQDVSQVSSFGEPPGYSQGCAVADFDGDGFLDLFVCCYGRSRLYHNLGDGTFRDVNPWAVLPESDWHTAAVFVDIDHDQLPDLIVARYADWTPATDVACVTRGVRDLCGPTSYEGTSCRVFRNCGDGQFEDWSTRFGLRGGVHGLAVVAADLNMDGWVDVYLASDVTSNQLYLGGPDLPFVESSVVSGVAVNEWGQAEGSMGVDVADFDGDGRPDIFVTNFEMEDNALYRNLDRGQFLHSSVAAGLSGVSRQRVGFGTAMTDFDGDGRPDLFVLNGNPIYAAAQSPFLQQSQLFRNLGGRFQDVTAQGGSFFREVHSGRGNAVADLDGDGALDLVVVLMNEPVRILKNRRPAANFIQVQLTAREGESAGIGSRVSVEFAGRHITRFVVRGTGFFSQADTALTFPVAADATAAYVRVEWPGRRRETFRVGARRLQPLIEGRGKLEDE
ncbi:MAG: CRTAC1 family protein [Planctomycetes bacterium]|nr:CRTAC1 family protein [Planctomycetota bacterium]